MFLLEFLDVHLLKVLDCVLVLPSLRVCIVGLLRLELRLLLVGHRWGLMIDEVVLLGIFAEIVDLISSVGDHGLD